jgi:hypothetical protein
MFYRNIYEKNAIYKTNVLYKNLLYKEEIKDYIKNTRILLYSKKSSMIFVILKSRFSCIKRFNYN